MERKKEENGKNKEKVKVKKQGNEKRNVKN